MKSNLIKSPLFPAAATLLLMAGLSAGATYPSAVLADHPLGYWRFSETPVVTPDPVANNLGTAGTNSDGTYVGSFNRGVPGVLAGSTATYFTGGGAVHVPNAASLNPNPPFSVEFWLKPDVVSGALTCPFSSTDFTPTPRLGWLFYTDDGYSGGYVDGGFYFRVYSSAGTLAVTSPAGLLTTNWTHVVGVVDGTNVVLYVNGQSVGSIPWSGTFTPNVNQVIGIGTRYDAGFPQAGSMDDVAIYPSALSSNDVKAHFDAASTNASGYATQILNANPAGYWRLNEPPYVSPVATNSGTLGTAANGSYQYWSTTELDLDSPALPGLETNNLVLNLDGTNGCVEIPTLNLNTNTVTIEAWVYLEAQTPWAGLVFSRGNTPDGFNVGADGQELSYTWNQNNGDTYGWLSGVEVPLNQWAYVALDIDPNEARVFLGTSDGWSAATNAIPHDSEGFLTNGYIGQDSYGGRFISGKMDEVAIYNQTLTEGQLRSHALAAFGGTNPPVLLINPPALTPTNVIYTTTPFTLASDAYGQPPLSYQWLKDGTNIPGVTALTYTKAQANTNDAGSYSLIVTNAFGAVTSQVAVVTISPAVPPTITQEPASRTAYLGGAASFSVVAGGTTPFAYQWTFDATNMPGATNATVIISSVAATNAGSYAVMLTNIVGAVTSTVATLSVATLPAATYEAAIVGAKPVGYWQLNEPTGPIAYDLWSAHDGTYSNVTLGVPGPLLNDPDTAASFNGFTSYVLIPQSGTLVGSAFTNITEATFICWVQLNGDQGNYKGLLAQRPPSTGLYINNDDTLNYAWLNAANTYGFDSGLVPPYGEWTLVAVVVQPTQAVFYMGSYSGGFVSVTNPVTHPPADFTAGPFAIGTDINYTGSDDRFFNGSIAQAAIFTNALTGAQIQALFNIGAYSSNTAPFIITQPVSETVQVGSPVTFNVTAGGSAPLAYQWLKGANPVSGATSSVLDFTSAYFTDSASYSVQINNSAPGSTNSSTAVLSVQPPPTFANLTNGLVLHLSFEGDSLTDSSGYTNNGIAGGSPAFVPGRIGTNAVFVNTVSESNIFNYVYVLSSPSLVFGPTNSFSVAFWVNYTGLPNDLPMIGNSDGSTYQPGWVFTDDTGKMELSLVSTADSGTYVSDPIPGSPTTDNGQWHHVVGIVDRDAQLASAYIDGVLAHSWSIAGLGNMDNAYSITLGQDPTGGYGVDGAYTLDDVGIWERPLSAYEASSIFAAGKLRQSFDVYGPVELYVNHLGTNVDVSWQAGTLLQSTNLTGPYKPVTGATAPFYRTTPGGSTMFYRVRQ
jgi:hypothetical protein